MNVKRINAVQNFDTKNILYTDKTGTLTADRIQLEMCIDVATLREADVGIYVDTKKAGVPEHSPGHP